MTSIKAPRLPPSTPNAQRTGNVHTHSAWPQGDVAQAPQAKGEQQQVDTDAHQVPHVSAQHSASSQRELVPQNTRIRCTRCTTYPAQMHKNARMIKRVGKTIKWLTKQKKNHKES
jgi:hypothetical protein